MAQVECLSAMMVGMKSRRDQIALAAEALYKMFDKGEEELVSQVSHKRGACLSGESQRRSSSLR